MRTNEASEVQQQEKPVVTTKAFETQRDDAIRAMRQSFQNLLVLLTKDFLADQYTNRTVTLDAEDVALESEWHILSESRSSLAPIASAKSRVLERKADDAIAAGDMEGSERSKREALEVQQNFDAVTERIRKIELRRAEIVQDKRRIAGAIFQDGYPSLPIASFAAIECVLDLLDGFRDGMFKFQTLAGLDPTSFHDQALIRNFHVEKLVPNGSIGRQLAYRVKEWFR